MTEINPDWIEAFRDGWLTADAAGKTGQRIEAGLRAALPLLEAELREQIATEIEGKKQNGPFAAPYNTALVIAADIAWGKGQT